MLVVAGGVGSGGGDSSGECSELPFLCHGHRQCQAASAAAAAATITTSTIAATSFVFVYFTVVESFEVSLGLSLRLLQRDFYR